MMFSTLRSELRSLVMSRPLRQKKNHGCDITYSGVRRISAQLPRLALAMLGAAIVAACGAGKAASTGPSISLTPQATTINAGASMSLTLHTTSATSCVGTSGISGPQPVNGTIVVPDVTQTTTFSVTCTGPDGTSTAQTEVVVVGDAPTITLTAAATTISSGAETTLTWNAPNATSCTSSNGWSGSLATSGTQSTGPLTDTTEYTLLCTGPGGSAIQSVTVTVDAGTDCATRPRRRAGDRGQHRHARLQRSELYQLLPRRWRLEHDPAAAFRLGRHGANQWHDNLHADLHRRWRQRYAVDHRIGEPLDTDGQHQREFEHDPLQHGDHHQLVLANTTACTAAGAWSGSEPVNGSVATGNLTRSEIYSLTCTGPGGIATEVATVTVSGAAPAVMISANPSAIVSGSATTLTWAATNATSCTASGGWSGAKPVSGSQSPAR